MQIDEPLGFDCLDQMADAVTERCKIAMIKNGHARKGSRNLKRIFDATAVAKQQAVDRDLPIDRDKVCSPQLVRVNDGYYDIDRVSAIGWNRSTKVSLEKYRAKIDMSV